MPKVVSSSGPASTIFGHRARVILHGAGRRFGEVRCSGLEVEARREDERNRGRKNTRVPVPRPGSAGPCMQLVPVTTREAATEAWASFLRAQRTVPGRATKTKLVTQMRLLRLPKGPNAVGSKDAH